jgi:molybdopterin converting factor small subunit
MRITFKLFASLTDFLPLAVRPGNQMALDVASTDTIDQIIAPFRMPPQLTHLVLVNGRYIPPAARASTTLHEGDTLAIWPPIAGG